MSIEAKKSYVGLTSLQFDGDSVVTHVDVEVDQEN